MRFDIQKLADVLVLEIQSNWIPDTTHSVHETVKEGLRQDIEPRAKHVIVDFDRCPFIESGGIGDLVSIKVSAEELGGRTVLCAVPDRVRTSLVVAGVWRLFDSYITRGEALNAIAAVGGKK